MNQKKNKLFLICPECQMEGVLRQKFGDDIYFLTALAAVFRVDGELLIPEVEEFLIREDVSTIVVVNTIDCAFIKNAISPKAVLSQSIDRTLKNIYVSLPMDGSNLSTKQRQTFIASTNVKRQIYELSDIPFIYEKITSNSLVLEGFVYDRQTLTFTPVQLRV